MLGASGMLREESRGICGEGGIRIVLLHSDQAVTRRLQAIIAEHQAYVIVGSADSWPACEVLLEEHLPELLIAEAALLPPASGFEPSGYPLVIRLRLTVDGQRADIDGIFEEFRHELQRVWQELYSRKACEMSALLDHYLAGLNSFSYLPSLTVYQNGECIELPAMEIQVVEASGNYVRIYAADKVYSIREAISSLNAKLDPDIFLRTHRSYIVNLQCVSRVIPRNGGPPALLLKNGRTVPIGPSYRSAVRRLFETDEELIA